MKKFLIVLLAVSLTLLGSSCEKDRSEEVLSTYYDFVTSSAAQTRAFEVLLDLAPEIKSNVCFVDKTFSDLIKPTEKSVANAYYEMYKEKIDSNTVKIISVEGRIRGTRNVQDYDIEADNVKIVFTYKLMNEENLVGTIEISGKLTQKEDAETKTCTSSSLIYQGKQMKDVSYTLIEKDNRYTSAIVDSKNVELRLLNAGK